MKKILSTFLLFSLLVPNCADAARLWMNGAEWQDANGLSFEYNAGGTNMTASTAVAHGGVASYLINPSAAFEWFGHDFGALVTTSTYVRTYIYITTMPSAGTYADIIALYDATAVSKRTHIRLQDDGTLGLFDDADAQVGSDSAVLGTGQWYRVELWVQDATNGDAEARIDGVAFASSATMSNGTSWDAVYFGSPQAAATFVIYYDDFAINNASAPDQTSWPGAGKIAGTFPVAAGDSACTAGVFSDIDDIPPGLATTTDRCELDTNPTTGMFNMTNSSDAGIEAHDTISLVFVLALTHEDQPTGTSNYFTRVQSASGGTASSSPSVDAGDATSQRTNTNGTTAWSNNKILYLDPSTFLPWTPTGTNSIDNMQCGVGTTDGAPDTQVGALQCMVEYVDVSPNWLPLFE